MPRNAAAADDSYRPDAVHEDEPRYLRRQKPVEIRRKKFGGKSASFYRRAFVFGVVATGLITAAALASDFLYHSPQVALLKPEQMVTFKGFGESEVRPTDAVMFTPEGLSGHHDKRLARLSPGDAERGLAHAVGALPIGD